MKWKFIKFAREKRTRNCLRQFGDYTKLRSEFIISGGSQSEPRGGDKSRFFWPLGPPKADSRRTTEGTMKRKKVALL